MSQHKSSAPKKGQQSQSKYKNSKRNRKKGSNGRLAVVRSQTVIKPCSLHYMRALANPFDLTNLVPPCIPDLYEIPSLKAYFIQKGIATIGTGQFGYVIAVPNPKDSDTAAVQSTTSAYALSYVYVAGPGVISSTISTIPYARPPPASRTVACGLRVRYIGSELNRGGRIIPYACTGDNDYIGNTDTSLSAMSRPSTKSYAVDRSWHGCTYLPTVASDYTYSDESNSVVSTPRMGIFLEGAAGNQFEYEYVVHLETTSNSAVTINSTTKSHSDVTGMSEVRDFFGGVSASEVGGKLWTRAQNYLKQRGIAIASEALGSGLKMLL